MSGEDLTIPPGFARTLILRLRANDFVRHGAVVFAASTVLNLCGFVFHSLLGRSLGVANYGALYALVSAVAIVALPSGIVGPAISRFAAEFRATGDDAHLRALISSLLKTFGILAFVYLAIGLAAARPLGAFLHVPPWAIGGAALIAAVSLLVGPLRAAAQGMQDFNGYAMSVSLEAIGKASLALVFFLKPIGLAGGLAAWLVSQILGGGFIGGRLFSRVARSAKSVLRIDSRRLILTVLGSAVATLAVTILSSADIILVKHYFPQHEAGIYAAASLGGKMLLFVVGFMPLVLLPKAADRHARGESTLAVLMAAMGLLCLVSIAGLTLFAVAGSQILRLLVGRAFAGASHLLLPYGVAMALLAAVSLLSSYAIAVHRFRFTVPLGAVVVAEMVGVALYHPSLAAVVAVLAVGNAFAVVAMALTTFSFGSPRQTKRPA